MLYINAHIKGGIQRKLRWVKKSINRWVLTSVHGAGNYIFFELAFNLIFNIFLFPFPLRTAQLIGEFWNNSESMANCTHAVPILFGSFC
jgi:hypothetical protein